MTQEPKSQQNSNGKRRIKIYRRTYDLPVIGGENLDQLQNAIKIGSEALQRGYIIKKVRQEVMVEQKGGFLGMSKKLVPKFIEQTVKQELKFEERFQQLDNLVKNYDVVIASLTEHQDDYQEFFGQLADEIREIVTLKCEEIASVEEDRLEVERIAQADWDDDLLQIATQQKIEILETAKTIGYAAILMLKKLDLMSLSLNKIANDQLTQKAVLESMVKKLSGQKKAYGADGAYASSTQKIYLSDSLFQSGAAPVNSVFGESKKLFTGWTIALVRILKVMKVNLLRICCLV
jgi:hypothetical protein